MSRIDDILKRASKTGRSDIVYRPVFISVEVAQELKEYCAVHGVTMKEIADALISDFLDDEYIKEGNK